MKIDNSMVCIHSKREHKEEKRERERERQRERETVCWNPWYVFINKVENDFCCLLLLAGEGRKNEANVHCDMLGLPPLAQHSEPCKYQPDLREPALDCGLLPSPHLAKGGWPVKQQKKNKIVWVKASLLGHPFQISAM